MMTGRRDWEIGALSRRLPDKSGGLALFFGYLTHITLFYLLFS